MHLFHCPDLEGELITLPEDEAHHAASVLRLVAGNAVGLLNGQGLSIEATLVEVSKKRVVAQVEARTRHPRERQATIHLAVAPTKQIDRYEWFVEKAVEIGVDRITPLITHHSERTKLRLDRLQRVAVSAMKQSQRTWLPQIAEPMKLNTLLQETLPQQRYFGWCEGEHRSLMTIYEPTDDVVLLIGPEGDFSMEEAALLRAQGFNAIELGAARLRTETA
ncbi:MAG: 16S rRNA (uracil(1498)-N(3))-methyltransferase, partial [Flavobacteriales bacterium]|nr:16S rRNA (uracil(1498)-N(3))-methyltransferase [Flavobacteriales bacterium]